MELFGGVDLLVNVLLGLEVNGLEGGLRQRVSMAWDSRMQLRTYHDRKRYADAGRRSIRSVVRYRWVDGEASSGPQQ
jgi:hypothetical protein